MRSLLLDTTSSFITVAIVENDKILFKFNEKIDNDISSKILPIISNGLDTNNLKISDIDKIFVCNGPGSFTGIRVGVTIAKVIAWSLKKEIVPLSSLELMATTKTNKINIMPVIDARRGNVFYGIYDNNLNKIKEDKLENFDNLNKDNVQIVSYDDINNSIKPSIDVLKIINKHKFDLGLNPHNVNPNYLKLTEAEENRLNDK